MQAYNFEWRDPVKHGEGKSFGFLAQKIIDVHPALVRTASDGYYKVNYDIVCALATTAIKDLQDQVRLLREELVEVKSASALAVELAELKAHVAELKAAGVALASATSDDASSCTVA